MEKTTAVIDFKKEIEWLERRGFHNHKNGDEYVLTWESKTKVERKNDYGRIERENAITVYICVRAVRKADDLDNAGFRAYAFWTTYDHARRERGGSPLPLKSHDNVIDALLEIRETIDEGFAKIEEFDYKKKRSHTDCIKSPKRWLDAVFPMFESWRVDGKKYFESHGYEWHEYHGFIFIRKSADGHAMMSITMKDVRQDFHKGKTGWRPSVYYGEEYTCRGRRDYEPLQIFPNFRDALKSIKHVAAKGNAFVDKYEERHKNGKKTKVED